MQKTLEQQRARYAWECIQNVQSEEFKGKYGSLARKVPMLILTNGLGQMLAFLKAKGNSEHITLFNHLSHWVLKQVAPASTTSNQDLLQWVLENDSVAYRQATVEALAFLVWLKRFAEAELPMEEV